MSLHETVRKRKPNLGIFGILLIIKITLIICVYFLLQLIFEASSPSLVAAGWSLSEIACWRGVSQSTIFALQFFELLVYVWGNWMTAGPVDDEILTLILSNREILPVRDEFKINEYLTLKLQWNSTEIYVAGEYFMQCKYLLFNVIKDKEHHEKYKNIASIDEMEKLYDRTNELQKDVSITPEEEFWGHCSNLQVWAENEYNCDLLHSNLAFPLLKKLMEAGDPKARRAYKEEIARRLTRDFSKNFPFLFDGGYLESFSNTELEAIAIDLSDPKQRFIFNFCTKTQRSPLFSTSLTNQEFINIILQYKAIKRRIPLEKRRDPLRNEFIERFSEEEAVKLEKAALLHQTRDTAMFSENVKEDDFEGVCLRLLSWDCFYHPQIYGFQITWEEFRKYLLDNEHLFVNLSVLADYIRLKGA